MFKAEKLCFRKIMFQTENNYIEWVVLLVFSDYDEFNRYRPRNR